MSSSGMEQVQLSGVFIGSLSRACVNLGYLLGPEADVEDTTPDGWYPASRFTNVLTRLASRFAHFDPIAERVGMEMMKLWYEAGPGHQIVRRGVDFLAHQASSEGYRSVVRGPDAVIGQFVLETLDEAAGLAVVRSTTPFDRALERGILRGGMGLCGDLVYVDVQDDPDDPTRLRIEFH